MDTPLQGRRALVTSSAGKFPGGEPGTALVPIPLPASADSGDDLYIDRAKSQTVEIGASHAVTVSEPDAVADLILAAVRETQR